MDEARPSLTARGVAMRRAAHQLLDHHRVLDDPMALRILGADDEARLRGDLTAYERPMLRGARAFLVARSRYTEDAIAEAVAGGVRQCVVLGAGLDTFAYRSPHASLRVFEVDHPATQAWKRARLADGAIAVPPSVTFVPFDLERVTLPAALASAGFDVDAPAFFSWLGVVVYLTRSAIRETLGFVAARPAGSEIVFDFSTPVDSYDGEERRTLEAFSAQVAAAGEPWVTFFDPRELAAELTGLGFHRATAVGPRDFDERYFRGRADDLRVWPFGYLMHALV